MIGTSSEVLIIICYYYFQKYYLNTVFCILQIMSVMSPKVAQSIITELGTVCGEVVTDSADTLAVVVEILTPWMQSKTSAERKMTLLVLRHTMRYKRMNK